MIANQVYVNLPPDTLAMLVVDFESAIVENGAKHLREELGAARNMLVALVGYAGAAELVESVRLERPRFAPVAIVLHGFEAAGGVVETPAWVSTLAEFFANNEALDEEDKEAICDLGVGESHQVGGGAFASVRIERAA